MLYPVKNLLSTLYYGYTGKNPEILFRYYFLILRRIHNQSKAIGSEGNVNETEWANLTYQARVAQQKQTVAKWSLQWQSIIRSSLGNTAYPYCLYIRSLDLGNLRDLFEDNIFRDSAVDEFFAGDMATFFKVQGTPLKKKTKAGKNPAARLNVKTIVELVGESITNYVSQAAARSRSSVALEELKGEIPSSVLPSWAGRLSRLRSMSIWDGAALDGSLATAITENCPEFEDLTFYLCVPRSTQEKADGDLASFFSGLRPNTLRSLDVIHSGSLGPETLLTLNNHAGSLKVLRLGDLSADAVRNLSLLKDCVSLETLGFTDTQGLINLEATENDVFLETVSWLGRCDKLQDISLQNFVSGPAILTPLCLQNNIRLKSLSVIDYTLPGNQEFHKAMSHQTSLESLDLRADAIGTSRDDKDTLISAICQLTKLKYLRLIGTSDYFSTPEIQGLASELRQLEEFHFGGMGVNDQVLGAIAGLDHLKVLNITALTSFTFDGLLNYISQLSESNRGLQIAIMSQILEYDLSEEELKALRKAIADKVDGKFDYILFREAESEFEGSDSD